MFQSAPLSSVTLGPSRAKSVTGDLDWRELDRWLRKSRLVDAAD